MVTGWACTSGYSPALQIHMYAGGTYSTGTIVGGTTANLANSTAASRCGTLTAHGFVFWLSADLANKHSGKTIFIYAIAPVSTIASPLLPNATGAGNFP